MDSKSLRDGLAGALIALIIVFLVYSVWQGLSHDFRNSFEIKVKNDLKQISILINLYHEDYDSWPVSLETLSRIENNRVPKFRLPETNTYWEFDWLYYPHQVSIDKIDRSQIILATPTHWDKDKKPADKNSESFRIVAYYDGTVKKISEKEYRANFKTFGFFLLITCSYMCQTHFDTPDAAFS